MPGGTRPPPEVMASWPTPNYINPATQGSALSVLSILLTTLTFVLVVARLWARLIVVKLPGLDDLFIVFGMAFAIGLSGCIFTITHSYGNGRHIWDVPVQWFSPNRKITWAAEWCFVLGTGCTKISILLFYRRLAAGTYTRKFLWATHIGIIYNACYMLSFCLALVFLCNPTDAYWLSFSPKWVMKGHKYKCAHENVSLPFSGAFSVIGDAYSTLLPILLIQNLQMSQKQKVALYSLFASGFLVVAAGIYRTILLDKVMNHSYDLTCLHSRTQPFWAKYVGQPVKSAFSSYGRSRARSTGKKTTQLSATPGFSMVSRERRGGYRDVDADQTWKNNYELRVVNVEAGIDGVVASPPKGISHSTTFEVKSDEADGRWPMFPNQFYPPAVATVRESEEVPRHSGGSEVELNTSRRGPDGTSMV